MMLQMEHGFNDNDEGLAPYFVRRWAPEVKGSQNQLESELSFLV